MICFKTETMYIVRQCSKCYLEAEYFCKTCSLDICAQCEQRHVYDLKTIHHNVIILPEKRFFIIYSMCQEEQRDRIARQQYEKIIHKIRSEAISSRCILLKEIRKYNKTGHTKTFNFQSEMQKMAENVKERINDWLKHFELKHRCFHQKREIGRYCSVIQTHEHQYENLTNKPVRFLSFVKKHFHREAEKFELTNHKQFFLAELFNRMYSKKILGNSIQVRNIEQRLIGNDNLFKLSLNPEVRQSFSVRSVDSCHHISCVTSDRAWISNGKCINMINTNGDNLNVLHDFCHVSDTDAFTGGVHTLNSENDLIYLDRNYSIKRLSEDMKTTNIIIKTENITWKPKCVYSSLQTGDLLVGMSKRHLTTGTGMISRYNKLGKLIQSIENNENGQKLYKEPTYMTENNNGDIVVSDWLNAVVVTERSGIHRFSYRRHPTGVGLEPRGICTDALSHILVCDQNTKTVLMLDKDGNFLSHLIIRPTEQCTPFSLSYDVNTHSLWVGSFNNSEVCVYMHLTRPDDITGKQIMYV